MSLVRCYGRHAFEYTTSKMAKELTGASELRTILDSRTLPGPVDAHYRARIDKLAMTTTFPDGIIPFYISATLAWQINRSHMASLCIDGTVYYHRQDFFAAFESVEEHRKLHRYHVFERSMQTGEWVCRSDTPIIGLVSTPENVEWACLPGWATIDVCLDGDDLVLHYTYSRFDVAKPLGYHVNSDIILVREAAVAVVEKARVIQRAWRRLRRHRAAKRIQEGMRAWLDAPLLRKRDRAEFGQHGIRPRLVMRKLAANCFDDL